MDQMFVKEAESEQATRPQTNSCEVFLSEENKHWFSETHFRDGWCDTLKQEQSRGLCRRLDREDNCTAQDAGNKVQIKSSHRIKVMCKSVIWSYKLEIKVIKACCVWQGSSDQTMKDLSFLTVAYLRSP